MKYLPLLACVLFFSSYHTLSARGGGGGFHGGGGGDFGGGVHSGGGDFGGGFRNEEQPRDDFGSDLQVDRTSQDNFRVDDSKGSADVRIHPEGDDTANVNVRAADGRDYDTTVAGPEGYRSGYIWRNGGYVAVDCNPFIPYAAPFGLWAGWSIVTQPEYLQYPVYTTYPVQTAVQLALQKLGLYTGPVDGNAASCAGAIEQYQMQNSMPVTGQISPELLTALGIQASQAGL